MRGARFFSSQGIALAPELGAGASCAALVAFGTADRAVARAGVATARLPSPREHGDGQRTDHAPTGDRDFLATGLGALAARPAR